MAWIPKGRNLRTFGILAGVAAGATVSWAVHEMSDKKRSKYPFREANSGGLGKVLASWTTNFEPMIPWDDNWDRRQNYYPPKSKKHHDGSGDHDDRMVAPTATRHILLIRHGQYNLTGDDDAGSLTELGQLQANATGQRLKELNHPYVVLIHSSMVRAIESARIIHKHLPDLPEQECDLLNEGSPYPPEPPIGNWRPEYKFFRDGARIEAAFRRFFHRASPTQKHDSYEIIVCHSNVIRYFVCRALQLPPEAWLRLSLYHGSITWVTIRPSGRVAVRMLGDAGHMPPQMLTVT